MLSTLWTWGLHPNVIEQRSSVEKEAISKLLILIDELLAEHHLGPSNYAQLILRNRPPMPDQTATKRLGINSPARQQWVNQWLPGATFAPHESSLRKGFVALRRWLGKP